jgi:RNA polymerase sigma-70 factor (ECF subfamily)
MSGQHASDEIRGLSTSEPCDHSLIGRSRAGDQDFATQLYLRYAQRLNSLVEMQCSAELARREGVEDIVQSVFRTFFRRIGEGYYDVPDEDELWRLLLVIALHKIRSKATYHHASKRNARRTIVGALARLVPDTRAEVNDLPYAHLKLVLEEILERLPAHSRVMVKLRIEGWDVAEVARKTGRSKRTVERILQETRLELVEILGQEG